jgi:putative transposase
MPSPITNLSPLQPAATATAQLFEDWFDPIETAVRERVHGFIQAIIEAELDEALSRARYARHAKACPGSKSGTPDDETASAGALRGHRHGHRSRSLMGTFGAVEINVPRARIEAPDGKTTEWKSNVLPAYQRRTKAADALIAGAYLAGTNTRRVRRALAALFGGAVSKDTVSRVWRKVKTDWEGWNQRALADEPIVRLILDGTVVRVRLDKKATTICLLVVLGIRADGQKVLLAVRNMGGETAQAWRVVLDDLIKRGLRKPEFLIVDGGSGLERALAEPWSDVPPSAAPCISTAICLPMRRSGCGMRCRRITTT